MARPKKVSDELLIGMVDEYYATVALGDISKMKFTALEAYSREHGTEIKEHVFRRNEAVIRRIDELRQLPAGEQDVKVSVGYRNLDAEGLIRGCSSVDDLINKLVELDNYWKDIYERYIEATKGNNKEILAKSRVVKDNDRLSRANAELTSKCEEIRKENKELKRENIYFRQIMERYVVPELARELMRQANLPMKEKRKYLNPVAYDELIEGRIPLPFTGKQGHGTSVMTRQEKLIEEMKGIAKRK